MRILITNDDGIQAKGIQTLWKELAGIGEVFVAAPDVEKSAMSQAITVHHPIRVDKYCLEEEGLCGWKIGGTPTDCIKIAVEALMDKKPDIIVSGINHGSNMGTDVLYSGTVSAAIEGALHGIPAVAVSLDGWSHYDFRPAAQFISKLIKKVENTRIASNTLLNVNVPALSAEQINGVEITKLGVRQYENVFEKRRDPRGRVYYWMGGNVIAHNNDDDSDISAVERGKISITPIHFDLTDYAMIKALQEWDL